MAASTVKKGRTVLQTSDPCPRGCRTGANGAVHLVSDHDDTRAHQCGKCSCVAQDVHDAKVAS